MSTRPDTSVPPWARRVADGLLVVLAAGLSLSTTGMQVAVVGLGVLAAVGAVRGWGVIRRTPLDGVLALLFGVFAISTLASGHLRDAVDWASLWIVLAYFAVFWWIRDASQAAQLVRVVVVAAAGAAAYGIVQHFTGIDWYRQLLGRPTSVRPRAPGNAGYAVVGFFRSYLTFGHVMLPPFAFAAAAALRGRIGGAVAAGLMAGAILYSTARGAWLAMAVMTLVLGLLTGGWRAWRGLIVLGALGALVIGTNTDLRDEATHMFSLGGVNAARMDIYAANLDIVREHPLLGLGFGRHRTAARGYYEAHPLADRRSHAHNNYLHIAAESGLLGLAAFMLVYGTALRIGWDALRRASSAPQWITVAGAWTAVLGFLIGGLTQYTFGDSEVALASWVALALIVRVAEPEPG